MPWSADTGEIAACVSLLLLTQSKSQKSVMPVGRHQPPQHMLLAITTSRLTLTVIVDGSLYLQSLLDTASTGYLPITHAGVCTQVSGNG